MSLSFDQPVLLLLALVAVPFAILGWSAMRGIDPTRRVTVLLLRGLVVLAIVVMLAGPHLRRSHDDLTVIGLLDVSGSVRRFARIPEPAAGSERHTYLEHLRRWFREATATRAPGDRFGLVVFDGEAVAVVAPARAAFTGDGLDVTQATGTGIADAIRLGLAMFPADSARRLVLVTDGNETVGDALAAARQAAGASDVLGEVGSKRRAVPIDVVPIVYEARSDVQIARVETPPSAQPGQAITVRIALDATEPISGRLTLRREGEAVDLNGPAPGRSRHVTVPAGTSIHLASVVLGETPVNRFEAIFEPDDPARDTLPDNNRAEAFVPTPGKGRVLIVSGRRNGPSALAALLETAKLPVTVEAPALFPTDLLSLQNNDLIVLDDVAAYEFTTRQHELIGRFVNDLGGGLIMIGGENGFGAGGWNGTAVEAVLPLELDPPKELRLPQAALVLVLDQSGSMNHPVAGARATQQEVANEAAAIAIESLRGESLVAVVTFHTFSTVAVPLQRNDDPHAIARTVRGITAGGGTDLEPALRLAHDLLRDVPADRKRVVCLTDGQSPKEDLDAIVRAMVADGIKLSTIAVGDDADHDTLRRLAEIGQGEFFPVYNPKSLPRVLVDSVKSINKPLIKEVPFVPVVAPTGSSLTAGLDRGPPLGGLVVTARRPDPRAVIELTHPDGEPLLARWQAGLGRVAAFTSDFGGPWSEAWAAWPTAASFWTQLVRTTARPAVSRDAELIAEIRNGRLEMTLEATDEDGAFIDYLHVSGTVYPPVGPSRRVRLRQTAPGRYEASVPAGAAGNYIVALNPMRGNRRLAPVIGGASRTTGDEFRRYESNLALLDRIAEITGGRTLDLADPARADLFERADMPASVSLRPSWRAILWAALTLMLLDIAGRRIAWSGAGLRRLGRRALVRVTPAQVHGHAAAATLASLRQVSVEFDDRLEADSRHVAPLRRQAAGPRDVSGARDGDAIGRRPEPSKVAAALGALLGRSRPVPPPSGPDAGPGAEPAAAAEAPDAAEHTGSTETTSGLLAAKRRTRERLDRGP